MPGKLNGRGGVRWRDRPDSRGTTRLEAVEFLTLRVRCKRDVVEDMKEKARHGRTLEIAVALLAALLVIGHSSSSPFIASTSRRPL